jgi:hypothetical protein
MALVAPEQFPGRWRYSVASAHGTLHSGTLATQQAITLTIRLPRETTPGGEMAKLAIRVHGSAIAPNGQKESARIENVSLHTCAAAHA